MSRTQAPPSSDVLAAGERDRLFASPDIGILECGVHERGLGDAPPMARDARGPRRRLVVVDAERFEVAADRELARTRDHGAPLSLLSVGIDRYGAATSQGLAPPPRALRGLAVACASELRMADLIGEIDPSTFVVLLPNTNASGARRAAERLRSAISSMHRPATQRHVTVSIGSVTTRTGKSPYRKLRSRADAKREDARSSGGNRVNA